MTKTLRFNISSPFFVLIAAWFCLAAPVSLFASDYDYDDEDEYEDEYEEDDDYDFDYGAKPKMFEVSAYGWYVFSAAINAKVITEDVNDLPDAVVGGKEASDVNYQDLFGMNASTFSFVLKGAYIYNNSKSVVTFDLSMLSLASEAILLTEDVIHGGVRYPAGVPIKTADASLMRIGLSHLWQVNKNRKSKFYLGAKVKYIGWESTIDTGLLTVAPYTQEVSDDGLSWVNTAGSEATQSYPVPLPLLTMRWRYQPKKVGFRMDWDMDVLPAFYFNYADTSFMLGYEFSGSIKAMAGLHVLYAGGNGELFVDYELTGSVLAVGANFGVEGQF